MLGFLVALAALALLAGPVLSLLAWIRITDLTRRVRKLENALSPEPAIPTPAEPKPIEITPPPTPVPAVPAAKVEKVDLETQISTRYLNRLGVVILLIGIVLFLGYVFARVGPLGKTLISYTAGAALLAGGLLLERRADYRVTARSMVAGGWATLFFTTFALYHTPAIGLVRSQELEIALLLVVGSGMIGHALWHRAQTVAAAAFGLTFLSLIFDRMTLFSLLAAALLLAVLLVLAVRLRWKILELTGILGSGAVHLAWQLTTRGDLPFSEVHPERFAGGAFLALFWGMNLAADRVWRRLAPDARLVPTVANLAALLIMGALLGATPEQRFYTLLGLGALYIALGAIDRSGGRAADFELQTLLGLVLVGIALPARVAGRTLALAWTVLFAASQAVGLRMNAARIRWVSWLAAYAAAVVLLAGAGIGEVGVGLGAPALLFGATVLAVACWATGSPRAAFRNAELGVYHGSTYLAVFFLTWGCALLRPDLGRGLLWSLLSLMLFWLAARVKNRHLGIQSLALAGLAAASLIAREIPADPFAVEEPLRVVWCGLAIASLAAGAFLARHRGLSGEALPAEGPCSALRIAAAGLAALVLLAQELPLLWVAAAWAGAGLLLLGAGARLRIRLLQATGLAWVGAAFFRALGVNLEAAGAPGWFSLRTVTVSIVSAVIYTAYAALAMRQAESESPVWQRRLAAAFAVAGTLLVGLLIAVEASRGLLTIGWVAQGVILLLTGMFVRRRVLRLSGLVLLLVCVGKVFFVDLQHLETVYRIFSFLVLGAMMILVSLLYARYRTRFKKLL